MPVDSPKTIWPVPLKQIEETVAAHLGPGRVSGNAAPACLSRQISMYLAKHVGGWSLPKIGRFYNGRHHTTVLNAIGKIERLRRNDDALDALIDVLAATLRAELEKGATRAPSLSRSDLIDAIASRVIERMTEVRLDTVPILVHTEG